MNNDYNKQWQCTIQMNNNVQWTTMTMNNANNNNIMATIAILNVTIHNDYYKQCIKWVKITMHNDYNEQWTMMKNDNNDNKKWLQWHCKTTIMLYNALQYNKVYCNPLLTTLTMTTVL